MDLITGHWLIRRLFHDPLLTEQGDLTETRNYSTYTRDMAGAIDLKYDEIRPFLRPGKIVDADFFDEQWQLKTGPRAKP